MNGTEIQNVSKMRVLLDGGASHDVHYRADIPPGAVEKEVEIAEKYKKKSWKIFKKYLKRGGK